MSRRKKEEFDEISAGVRRVGDINKIVFSIGNREYTMIVTDEQLEKLETKGQRHPFRHIVVEV